MADDATGLRTSDRGDHPLDARRGWLADVLLALLLPALGLLLLSSTGRDDSHITYWAAHGLARFGRIINCNGEAVEQCSSLGQLLLLGLLARVIPLSLPTLGPLTSIFFGAATVCVTGRLAAAAKPRLGHWAAALTATATPLLYWSFSGLETSLAAFLTVSLCLAWVRCLRDGWTRRNAILAVAVTVGYLLVRPEAAFIAVGALGFIFVCTRSPGGRVTEAHSRPAAAAFVRLLLLLIALAGAIAAFRMFYFGVPFPQPVIAKMSGHSLDRAKDGLKYVLRHMTSPGSVVGWLAPIGLIFAAMKARRDSTGWLIGLVSATFVVVQIAFVTLSGGDWMENGRFLAPTAPLAVVAALVFFDATMSVRLFRWVTAGLIVSQLAGVYRVAALGSYGMPLWRTPAAMQQSAMPGLSFFEVANRLRGRDAQPTAHLIDLVARLRAHGVERVSLMTGQIGFVGYHVALAHYGHLRIIDRRGLGSTEFTTCPLTRRLPRDTMGLKLDYEFFFTHLSELRRACGVEPPDLIFDVAPDYHHALDAIRSHGYRIVYQGDGSIVPGPDWLRGLLVYRDAFIAVREDLVPALGR